ncbi:hypothetical protein FQA39_LY08318 [Lamprigera yunnana]|nr:hypothetical protein FQA39_LY08318 [Lamprigera yunnana]
MRPFSRFSAPSQIPRSFIERNQELVGTVHGVDPNSALLLIKHKPLIPLPFGNGKLLPVKLAGIDISQNGVSWLHTIIVGSKVSFTPISVQNNWVQCRVNLEQLSPEEKLKTIDVGESLVSVGFASVDSNNIPSKKYLRCLQAAELRAQRKQMGLMFYIKSFENSAFNLIKKLNRPSSKTPANVNLAL